MKLSIVVPAYNSEETLERCLTAILAARAEREDCEVIVVDDGSEDRTVEIAQRFPVRLLRSERNEGRIRARERGARAARSDRILFVDARILIPPDTLRTLEALDYEPVVGGSSVINVPYGSALDRLLFLIRKRIYAPYYPQSEDYPTIMITQQNFDRVPKGMNFFYVDKERFFEALPDDRSKYVSDDTRIFAEIVAKKEIAISRDLRIVHIERQTTPEAYRHIFERGPRFADYYLHPGKRYYPIWKACCLLGLAAFIGSVFWPPAIFAIAAIALLSLLVISFRLAETFTDFLIVLVVLPPVSVAFGLGILKGKLYQFRKASASSWNRPLAIVLVLSAAALYYLFNKNVLQGLQINQWGLLPLLAAVHLAFLGFNGLILKTFLTVYDIRLNPREWFGLAAMTAMGSYMASGAGGATLRAVVLKHKFDVSHSKFIAILTVNYLINVILAAFLGLGACVAYYAGTGLWHWELALFFALTGGAAVALAAFRPSLPVGEGRLRELMDRVYEGWDILRSHPRVLAQVGAMLAANFLLQTLALILGFALFSISLQALPALLIAVVSSFSIFLALTPAGLGIQEAVSASVSHLVGYGFHHGLAAVVVYRAVSMVNIFVLGPIFSYLLLRKS